MPLRTLDVDQLVNMTGSIYESVAILAKRSRQLGVRQKAELDEKLSYYEGFGPEMETTQMQDEQMRVSIEHERKPKATEVAVEEMFEQEIYFRNPTEDE